MKTLPCCCALLKEIGKDGNVIGGDRLGPSVSSSRLVAAEKLATADRKYLPAKRGVVIMVGMAEWEWPIADAACDGVDRHGCSLLKHVAAMEAMPDLLMW
jgi:hypothetical protein